MTDKRIRFKTRDARDAFFNEILLHFGSWKDAREYFGIYRSRFDSFRSGKTTLPQEVFKKFEMFTKNSYYSSIELLDSHWGRAKGGHATYKRHPEIFKQGKKIVTSTRPKYLINHNLKLNMDLCELIGAFIGDGFTNIYGRGYMIQFAGDARYDSQYYNDHVIPIIADLMPSLRPSIRKQKNTLRVTIYSRELHYFLTKRFGFKPGKKVYSVTIPKEIVDSDMNNINACLRGIFDTDGSVYFDKRSAYKKPYVRIGLKMESKHLMRQIHKLLLKQKINARFTEERLIQINGYKEVKRYMQTIGFSNPRHKSKIDSITS